MAFVTMIFAYMVIAGVIAMVIAGTISTIGLIVLIISLIRRHRAKVRGETPKKFGLSAAFATATALRSEMPALRRPLRRQDTAAETAFRGVFCFA